MTPTPIVLLVLSGENLSLQAPVVVVIPHRETSRAGARITSREHCLKALHRAVFMWKYVLCGGMYMLNLELREIKVEMGGREFTIREHTGKKVFKFDKLIADISTAKEKEQNEELWKLYYECMKLIIDVSDEWLDENLSGDRLLAFIILQQGVNKRSDLVPLAVSLLPSTEK